MMQLILAGSAACLLGLITTWVVRKFAPRVGLVDQPDGHRKLHQRVTALGGGVAVLVSFFVVAIAAIWWTQLWPDLSDNHQNMLVGLLAACTFIVIVGVIDDRFGLRGRQKLLAQVLAALILLACGVSIQNIQVFGWNIELGMLSSVFTIFWLLGAINAINLLDGIDGLAATVGVILSAAIAAMAMVGGRMEVALVAIVFAGSLAAFLRYNFPPASIFLGDAGSMLIGLVVGTLAVESSLKGPGTVLLAAPLAIWTIPILDSFAAILRRKLTGRSIYTTDRAHFHHRLMDRWKCNRRTLAFVALCCTITSLAGLGSIILKNDLVALITCSALLAILISFRIFGHTEFALAANRATAIGTSLVTPLWGNRSAACQSSVRLQGSRQWEILWESLVEWAEKMNVSEIQLDLNLPLVHEGYYASWKKSGKCDQERVWRFTLPLECSGNRIGSLLVVAERNHQTAAQDLEALMCLLEPFELSLNKLAQDLESPAPKAPIPTPNIKLASGQSLSVLESQ